MQIQPRWWRQMPRRGRKNQQWKRNFKIFLAQRRRDAAQRHYLDVCEGCRQETEVQRRLRHQGRRIGLSVQGLQILFVYSDNCLLIESKFKPRMSCGYIVKIGHGAQVWFVRARHCLLLMPWRTVRKHEIFCTTTLCRSSQTTRNSSVCPDMFPSRLGGGSPWQCHLLSWLLPSCACGILCSSDRMRGYSFLSLSELLLPDTCWRLWPCWPCHQKGLRGSLFRCSRRFVYQNSLSITTRSAFCLIFSKRGFKIAEVKS